MIIFTVTVKSCQKIDGICILKEEFKNKIVCFYLPSEYFFFFFLCNSQVKSSLKIILQAESELFSFTSYAKYHVRSHMLEVHL